jgi:hypothetical protein
MGTVKTQRQIDRARSIERAGQHCHTNYGASGLCHGGPSNFVNSGRIVLQFQSMVTGEVVEFDGFITDYTDSFEPSFETQEVYGRMDPIAIFKNTKRKISIGWSIVGVNHGEMASNWHKMQKYIQMLYPSYKNFSDTNPGALALSSPPLMKMRFMNWAMDSSKDKVEYKVKPAKYGRDLRWVKYDNNGTDYGLLVVPGSITVNTNLNDRGAVLSGKQRKKGGEGMFEGGYAIFPREITVSSDYTVLHQHELGHGLDPSIKEGLGGIRSELKKKLKKLKTDKQKKIERSKTRIAQNLLLSGANIKPRDNFKDFPYGMRKK